MAKGLCSTCSSSIWCPTWAEVKCTVKEQRIYNHAELTSCPDYKKRPANWRAMRCRCEDCLKNGILAEEYLEDE